MNYSDKKKSKKSRLLKILGPGIITGTADNDPSGIATYSQAGAQFGYGQLWATIFLYPLMTAVQEASARIGSVTKKGIAAVTRDHYSKKILYGIVSLIFVANTINIGADIGAMAASLELILPIPFSLSAIFFAIAILSLEIFVPYRRYVHILKWLILVIIAYPITLLLIEKSWTEIAQATFFPYIELTPEFIFIFTGVVGTTISPYMFFWQASEEVEEEIVSGEINKPLISKRFITNMRIDNALGMFISQFITWCIIVVAGTVLHKNGITDIATAADAARSLEPLVNTFPGSGYLTRLIFAFGIIGLGLIAIPVLAGSAAYSIAETFRWNEGLYRKLREAHGFYGVIILSTLLGLGMNFIGINPIKALIFTAVINALVSAPLILLIILLSSNKKIMGEHTSGPLSKTLLWITLGVITLTSIATIVTLA